ncbi:MAG: AAA family ATPase [Chitinophagales bacterium]
MIFKGFTIENSSNTLIIEGAGGLCSPINNEYLNIDLIIQLKVPVVVVINNYLGSINHSIMTIQTLQQANIDIIGIIFVGDEVKSSEAFIVAHTNVKKIGYIPFTKQLDKQFIQTQAEQFKTIL